MQPIMASKKAIEKQISMARDMLLLEDLQKKEEAVSILINISRQGNQEATDILKKCVEAKEGITPDNEDDINWCIKTSEEEKRLWHAVKELYNSMKKAGEDKVTFQDIDEALKKAEAKLKVRVSLAPWLKWMLNFKVAELYLDL